jgi:hypothetical protein
MKQNVLVQTYLIICTAIKFFMATMVVDVDEQLLKEFRRFAVNKRGKIYGVLKPEVELALRNHLKLEGKATPVKGDVR